MAVEHIKETDTLNQGRIKINEILDQSNASSEKVDSYKAELATGISEAKKIADEAGQEAVNIATEAGNKANETADQALVNSKTAITTADQAVSTANNNKQEFDTLRNDFDQLVAESGDSNPEIVQARTDTQGVKRPTLAARLHADFSDRMTKTEGISLFSQSTNIKMMMDFNGKTAGNITTNPHTYYSDFTAKILKKPADIWNEVSQSDYNKLASRDDSGVVTGSTQNGVIPQQMGVFDVVETVKRLTPQTYETMSREQITMDIKEKFVAFTISVRVKATSPNNKNSKVATYIQSTDSWSVQLQESASEFTDFTVQVNDSNFVTKDGYIYLLNYTDPSNGVSSASLDVDYSGVQVELLMNGQEVLTESGFAKIEDIHTSLTKENIGLGNVENYGIASQSEAQSGKSDEKYMTPLKTTQALKAMLLDMTYPIGSIYQSLASTDPATLFGGTWERLKGKMLIGVDESDPDFSEAGKTGGAKTHKLSINEIPSHAHQQKIVTNRGSGNTNNTWSNDGNSDVKIHPGVFTEPAGGGQEHNNMSPYLTVYIFKRIS